MDVPLYCKISGSVFTSDDIMDYVEELTASASQMTPRTVTITDILNAVIEGLESAVAR